MAMVKPRCHTWTHKFICLADTHQEQVPSMSERHRLWSAGLGEKKIVFRLDGDWSHIKEVLMETFPPLKSAGGMELLHTAGSYSKNLLVIETRYIISVLRLKEYVDQAKVYVRPLQVDLPLTYDVNLLEVSNIILILNCCYNFLCPTSRLTR